MKRLFIHAGPPKTATTSLQILLHEIDIPRTVFIGAFQPREEMNANGMNSFGNSILRFIRGENDEKNKSKIRERIRLLFEEYDNIIYSEEMILHTGGWKDNITRTFQLFGDLDVSLTYCLRDARKSVPSYYCESYGHLDKSHQENFDSFLQTEWIGIYDLENVYARLVESGFRRINCFSFDDFVGGRLNLNQIFGVDFVDQAWLDPLVPPLSNKKSVSDDKEASEGTRYTVILDKYRSLPSPVRRIIDRLRLIGLGGIGTSIRRRMVERREVVVKPSPVLEKLFLKNRSFRPGDFQSRGQYAGK